MLKRLSLLLAQLRESVDDPQISYLPGPTDQGGMAIMVSWTQNGAQHEIGHAFTAAELEKAEDADLELAVEVLCAAAWTDIAEIRGDNLTPEQAMQRVHAAAQQSPKNQATASLALLGPNG